MQRPVSPAEGSKDADQLRKAQLEAEMWAEQSRKLHAEAEARGQEVTELKQDRQKNQEAVNRCVLEHGLRVQECKRADFQIDCYMTMTGKITCDYVCVCVCLCVCVCVCVCVFS